VITSLALGTFLTVMVETSTTLSKMSVSTCKISRCALRRAHSTVGADLPEEGHQRSEVSF
jgi:hypothetical protein